jgi:hypothetical protein
MKAPATVTTLACYDKLPSKIQIALVAFEKKTSHVLAPNGLLRKIEIENVNRGSEAFAFKEFKQFADQVKWSCMYLTEHVQKPKNGFEAKHNSYHLKHLIEREREASFRDDDVSPYVSNGATILAAFMCGFEIIKLRAPNAYVVHGMISLIDENNSSRVPILKKTRRRAKL